MQEPTQVGEITRLLQKHVAGSTEAFDELVTLVYQELRRLARQQLRRAKPSATLDTVALVNEAYMRLVDDSGIEWECRSHFYGVMARAMRFVVVDHARRHAAQKRGGGERPLTLDPERIAKVENAELVLLVNDAVDQLQSFNSRLAYIVECRFFAGMTDTEVAESLDVSSRTVQRDWRRAQAWLQRFLANDPPPD